MSTRVTFPNSVPPAVHGHADQTQHDSLKASLPQWLAKPLYRQHGLRATTAAELAALPLVTKHDLRTNFPHNFLSPDESLEALLEANSVELEYTSGTTEDRVPVLLPRGWWDAQEERALRLNDNIARIL